MRSGRAQLHLAAAVVAGGERNCTGNLDRITDQHVIVRCEISRISCGMAGALNGQRIRNHFAVDKDFATGHRILQNQAASEDQHCGFTGRRCATQANNDIAVFTTNDQRVLGVLDFLQAREFYRIKVERDARILRWSWLSCIQHRIHIARRQWRSGCRFIHPESLRSKRIAGRDQGMQRLQFGHVIGCGEHQRLRQRGQRHRIGIVWIRQDVITARRIGRIAAIIRHDGLQRAHDRVGREQQAGLQRFHAEAVANQRQQGFSGGGFLFAHEHGG